MVRIVEKKPTTTLNETGNETSHTSPKGAKFEDVQEKVRQAEGTVNRQDAERLVSPPSFSVPGAFKKVSGKSSEHIRLDDVLKESHQLKDLPPDAKVVHSLLGLLGAKNKFG